MNELSVHVCLETGTLRETFPTIKDLLGDFILPSVVAYIWPEAEGEGEGHKRMSSENSLLSSVNPLVTLFITLTSELAFAILKAASELK
jgi:hypothetical protein